MRFLLEKVLDFSFFSFCQWLWSNNCRNNSSVRRRRKRIVSINFFYTSISTPFRSHLCTLHRIKLIKSNFCFQVPVAVPVDRPVAVPVPKPYPVEVTRHVAVPVERPVPVPIKVPVPAPYAIKVPQPYAVPYVKQIPLPVVQPAVVIEKYNHGGWPSGYSSW